MPSTTAFVFDKYSVKVPYCNVHLQSTIPKWVTINIIYWAIQTKIENTWLMSSWVPWRIVMAYLKYLCCIDQAMRWTDINYELRKPQKMSHESFHFKFLLRDWTFLVILYELWNCNLFIGPKKVRVCCKLSAVHWNLIYICLCTFVSLLCK